eukprot:TRINITY_DN588_c0_g1_i8.p1 TRINITY_DN588_c0_g1~~TRINITY_DN588_c0_g1_i8.p1  ORF type:complete len:287 (+),score=14.81 TRINITY_DN588_c0_g1_i8:487-1347(+)
MYPHEEYPDLSPSLSLSLSLSLCVCVCVCVCVCLALPVLIPFQVNTRDQCRYPLHEAVMNGHPQLVEILLASPVFRPPCEGKSHMTATKNRDAVQMNVCGHLSTGGKNTNEVNRHRPCDGATPLMLTGTNNNNGVLQIADMLLRFGADVHARDSRHNATALLYSWMELGNRNLNYTRWLLDHGADITARTARNETILHLVIQRTWGSNEIFANYLTTLLSWTAPYIAVDARDIDGVTPLMLAVKNMAAFRLLVKRGADVHARDSGMYSHLSLPPSSTLVLYRSRSP